MHFDLRTILPAREDAILILAQQRHLLGQPNPRQRQHDDEGEGHEVDHHAAGIVVRLAASFVLLQAFDSLTNGADRLAKTLLPLKGDAGRE
jgi:hypothetical protein